jgi:hypothetical protein
MGIQLLVRNVPSDICKWIDQQRGITNMSQQEVVLSVLGKAVQADLEITMPLFSTPHIIEKSAPDKPQAARGGAARC